MDTLVFNLNPKKQDHKHITIRVSYLENSYQETKNVQDFTFESCFSSLGGFIGIFLGWSMMNVPGFLEYVFGLFYKGK